MMRVVLTVIESGEPNNLTITAGAKVGREPSEFKQYRQRKKRLFLRKWLLGWPRLLGEVRMRGTECKPPMTSLKLKRMPEK